MQIVNNIVKADLNKILKTEFGYFSELTLGEQISVINGIVNKYNVTIDDIKEVNLICINNNVYYIESNDYPKIVTELIRQKYSLDDELALVANSRINPESLEEKDFLEWRKICKLTAKKWTKTYQYGGE